MKILTTSGLYISGTAENILIRLSDLVDAGVPIHGDAEGRYFLGEEERYERYRHRTPEEIDEMSPEELLHDMEDAGHFLVEWE